MRKETIKKMTVMAMLAALSMVLVYAIHVPLIPVVPFLEYDRHLKKHQKDPREVPLPGDLQHVKRHRRGRAAEREQSISGFGYDISSRGSPFRAAPGGNSGLRLLAVPPLFKIKRRFGRAPIRKRLSAVSP